MANRSKKKSRPRHRRTFAVQGAQLAEWCVWLMLLALWFVHDTQLKDAFRLPKLALAQSLALASLVFLAWGYFAAARQGSSQHDHSDQLGLRTLWNIPALRAAVPLLVAALVSALGSDYPHHSHAALIALTVALVAFVAWSVGLPRPRLEALVHGLIWPALGLALVAIGQFHDVWRPFDFAGDVEQERLGVTSFAGSAGDLAMFLLLPCLIAQERLFRSWGGKRSGQAILWGLALGICIYGVVVSGTVSALGVLAVASAALWWWLLPRRKAVVLVAALVATGLAVVLLVTPLRERVMPKVQQLARGDLDAALTGRLDGWKAAGWMFENSPIFGVGHGAYRPHFAEAKLELTESGVEFYRGQNFVTFANAHNEYLEAAAEWGLLGLAALAWALWQVFQRLRLWVSARSSAAERDHRWSPEAALVCAGTLALALIALVQFPFRIALTGYAAVLWLAWVFAPFEEERS